jgi:glycosyltransferase involved in cell wall biosynthesis
MPGTLGVRLHASGWLGANNRRYFHEQHRRLRDDGLGDDFLHVECPDHASKVRFLHDVDVLSVPTTYREPKGLYVLEALANGIPVVQPRHGSFPELIERTGGGLLVEPHSPEQLALALRHLLDDRGRLAEMGEKGRAVVHQHFNAARMAESTLAVYRRYVREESALRV